MVRFTLISMDELKFSFIGIDKVNMMLTVHAGFALRTLVRVMAGVVFSTQELVKRSLSILLMATRISL